MLPAYGVLVGEYTSFSKEQGKWLHAIFSINAAGVQYQAAVDVNEPNGLFQYQILGNLDLSRFTSAFSLASGWHHLDSNPTSGAVDYARSSILANLQPWTNVTGDEAGDALIAMVTSCTKLFVFGAPFTSGNGVHDVHCNQGDPPGQFRSLDGIWQDGCVFLTKSDGSLSAYLGKFSTQSLDTDNNGIPI